MRKLVLASAAISAIATSGTLPAAAQLAGSQVNLPLAETQGVPAKSLAMQGASDSNNTTAVVTNPGVTNPVPGSIVVRLNATVRFYVAAESSSLDKTAG
jgi:hypothetical protein